jgi:hypothetical protein
LQSIFDRSTIAGNFEPNLCSEESSHTLPEQGMVVYQQDLDSLFHRF